MNSITIYPKIYRWTGEPVYRLIVILLYCLTSHLDSPAQSIKDAIQQRVESATFIKEPDFERAAEITAFYRLTGYQPVWLALQFRVQLENLLNSLQKSPDFGLEEEDYQYRFVRSFRINRVPLHSASDSVAAELRLTDAALHFYTHIAYGNKKPALGYEGLPYRPSCFDIPALLKEHLYTNKLLLLAAKISDGLPELAYLQSHLIKLNKVVTDSNFKEVIVGNGGTLATNEPLRIKLYQLNIIDSVDKKIANGQWKEIIKEAQRQFNLPADGSLRSNFLREINIPVVTRIQQLKRALNYYRWLGCLTQQQQAIVVNIPAAYLKVYFQQRSLLEMRIIAGKPVTPTPTLSSTINEVILYPYWHVPYSIATKELLPLIKRNPGYIDANNYQVLNQQGKIMNPYAISWHLYSTSYFPFLIRQSTGCDNALGLIKFNFYNPFSVYLHDTPTKPLFSFNRRFFSHGCMRLQKPMELGHLILGNNRIAIDTLEQKGCLAHQQPIVVPVQEPLPVVVWYNLVGIDSTGRVIFYEDIYNKKWGQPGN